MNTWMDTREKVFAYIREHRMLQAHDRVVAGVSGGADSVCLLFLLLEWQKICPIDIAVVHVNHGIRAEAGCHIIPDPASAAAGTGEHTAGAG